MFHSSHIFVFGFWYFSQFSCVIFFPFFRLLQLRDFLSLFWPCPSCLAKCKQRFCNIFVTGLPKVTKNKNGMNETFMSCGKTFLFASQGRMKGKNKPEKTFSFIICDKLGTYEKIGPPLVANSQFARSQEAERKCKRNFLKQKGKMKKILRTVNIDILFFFLTQQELRINNVANSFLV